MTSNHEDVFKSFFEEASQSRSILDFGDWYKEKYMPPTSPSQAEGSFDANSLGTVSTISGESSVTADEGPHEAFLAMAQKVNEEYDNYRLENKYSSSRGFADWAFKKIRIWFQV
jgi:hypothetical protein